MNPCVDGNPPSCAVLHQKELTQYVRMGSEVIEPAAASDADMCVAIAHVSTPAAALKFCAARFTEDTVDVSEASSLDTLTLSS
jgi:hypothetical protein